MDEIQALRSELNQLIDIVTDLEQKANDLYSRPLMPYSTVSGYVLTLSAALIPEWTAP
jgi:hypothetical protein